MPSIECILFGKGVDAINRHSEEIANLATVLGERGVIAADEWQRYDLRRSVQNLREAANRLDEIREQLIAKEISAVIVKAAKESA